jgi:putative membrane protein
MFALIMQWLLSTLALLAVSKFLPGYYVEGLMPAVIAALVIGLLNALFGAVMKAVTFRFFVLILGALLLGINVVMILMASRLVTGFDVQGLNPALWGAAAMAVLGLVMREVWKEA